RSAPGSPGKSGEDHYWDRSSYQGLLRRERPKPRERHIEIIEALAEDLPISWGDLWLRGFPAHFSGPIMSTQPTPSAASPRRSRTLALRAVVGLAGVALGAGLSFGAAKLLAPGDAASDPPHIATHHAESDPLARLDDLMSAGDYARALPMAHE